MAETLLQFAHITDTHLIMPGQQRDYSDIDPEWAEYARQILALPYTSLDAAARLVAEINALPLPLDFVLHTGDLAGQLAAPDDYRHFAQVLSGIQYPIHYLPGNHDVSMAFQEILLGRTGSFDHEFEHNGVQIVCVDSTGGPVPHSGWLSDDQLIWLEKTCSPRDERPLLVALHHHVLPLAVPWMDEVGLLNGAHLHEFLRTVAHRLYGVFHGHVHQGFDRLQDGVLYSSAASAWCQFASWPGLPQARLDTAAQPGFSVVTITAGQTTVCRHHYPVD